MRRLITFCAVAAATAAAALHWLNDGDLSAAVQPVLAEWDAELLARNAGLQAPTEGGSAPDALQEAPETP